MVNFRFNSTSMSQNAPGQNIPVQTSQNNFQMFQQAQNGNPQMQGSPSNGCAGNAQDYKQAPCYQYHQGDMFNQSHQHTGNILPSSNLCQPVFQTPCNPSQAQQQSSTLPQSILEQIRACVGSVAPIFILPSSCHQSPNQQQPTVTPNTNQATAYTTGQQPGLNYTSPTPVYCPPPSFYPYPIPLPLYQTSENNRNKVQNCECPKMHQQAFDLKGRTQFECHCDVECHEHRCTPTTDGTICTKLNCPSSINLQALVSQLLSMPGIISCTASRLILRKIPGSNITTTMDNTMDTAQRCLNALTKEQLLTESKIAQQINGLINLHITNNPPANIIPILTLIQLKVNVLKNQVENLINKKVMENEAYTGEVDTSKAVEPAALVLKSDSELRQLLSALRQKECDERVNVNFAPYRSQRVIAECRLNNIQNKIRQVEAEFDRRRYMSASTQPITTRVVPTEASESFAYARSKYSDIDSPDNGRSLESPNPFSIKLRSPRRLNLKPHVGSPETTYDRSEPIKTAENTSTTEQSNSVETNKEQSENKNDDRKEKVKEETNEENKKDEAVGDDKCAYCNKTISEESLDEDKKKLQTMNSMMEKATVTSTSNLYDESPTKLTSNISSGLSSGIITAENDDLASTESVATTNKTERSSIHGEIVFGGKMPKIHWFSETFDTTVTKDSKTGIDSAESVESNQLSDKTIDTKTQEKINVRKSEDKDVKVEDTEKSKQYQTNNVSHIEIADIKEEQTEPVYSEIVEPSSLTMEPIKSETSGEEYIVDRENRVEEGGLDKILSSKNVSKETIASTNRKYSGESETVQNRNTSEKKIYTTHLEMKLQPKRKKRIVLGESAS